MHSSVDSASVHFEVLDIEQVLYIHEAIIQKANGIQGIRDFALLHSALERPKASYAGQDLYESIEEKAAAVLHSLVMNHAFLDGNKRTAYAVMLRFLNANDRSVRATQDEVVEFCLAVDNKGWEVPEIYGWLRAHVSGSPVA